MSYISWVLGSPCFLYFDLNWNYIVELMIKLIFRCDQNGLFEDHACPRNHRDSLERKTKRTDTI